NGPLHYTLKLCEASEQVKVQSDALRRAKGEFPRESRPDSQLADLPAGQPACRTVVWHVGLPTVLLTSLLARVMSDLFTFLLACRHACWTTNLQTYQQACCLAYLQTDRHAWWTDGCPVGISAGQHDSPLHILLANMPAAGIGSGA